MSRPFAAVESFLERILERPAARLFRAHPQPVQLERRIERAMSAMRVVRSGQTWVPSRYRVSLHPSDLEALQASGEDISSALAEAILVRARSQGQWLLKQPEVSLVASARVQQGDLEVDAEPLDSSLVAAAAGGLRPVELEGPKAPRAPIPGTGVIADEAVIPAPPMVSGPSPVLAPGPDAWPEAGWASVPIVAEAQTPPPAIPAMATAPLIPPGSQAATPVVIPAARATTSPPASAATPVSPAAVPVSVPPAPAVPVSVPPAPAVSGAPPVAATGSSGAPPPLLPPPLVGPRAIIEVRLPDGTVRDVTFDGTVISVGRGTENDIVIADERVSRRHGRFSARHGTLVYTDLGSTNGSQVGGVRVREVALGAGDVVRLGRASLTIRPRA